MSKIAILLSSYNGEKYIEQQIDSLLSQKYKNIDIIVRDDGSKDGTIEILKKYKNKIKLIIGENIGVISSFNELIMYVSDYDFYVFCYQDVIW